MMDIFDTWTERVTRDDVWAYGTIRQFVNAILPRTYGHTGGQRTNIDGAQATAIVDMLAARVQRDGGPLVTTDQADRGREWLHRYAKRLGLPTDIDYRAITAFRFRGGNVLDENHYRMVAAPIYRAYWPNGSTLTYTAIPWQSGGTDRHDFRWEEAA